MDVSDIQRKILRELIFHRHIKFSELNIENVSSDQFSFHIKRLIELDLVEKDETGYELTSKGKEFANRFDTDDAVQIIVERQAKISALSVPVRTNASGETEYLMQQRLKQPYYGFYGFVGGKVRWGESLAEAAARELKEETGLTAELIQAGIEHKTDYKKGTGEILEDKFFFFFRGENSKGTLIEQFTGGRNVWLPREEIAKLPDLLPDVPELLDILESGTFRLIERKFEAEKY